MNILAKIVMAGSILAGVPTHAVTEINYWLWDNNQLASYQACAEAFEKQNPDIKIKITQTGWFDYWTALSTAFVSGTVPDVLWDHLSRYPEFISNNLLVDLAPLPELTVFCNFSPIHLNQTQNDNPQKNALFVQDPISSQFPCWHSRSGGNGNHLLVMG